MERRKNDLPDIKPEVVSRNYEVLVKHYADILQVFPDAQFTLDPPEESGNRVIRFKKNRLYEWLGETWKGPCYNDIATAYYKGRFGFEEYMEFYQGIGYSLGGFLDIFGDEVAAMVAEGRVMRAGARPKLTGGSDGPTVAS